MGANLLAPRTATIILVGSTVTVPLPTTPTEEPDYSGISQPIYLAWLPNGLMLIASKAGVIYVANGNTVLPTPFIDIKDIVYNRNDRGLVSIAVHPNFNSNPYVYLFYSYEGTDNVQDPPGTLVDPVDKEIALAGWFV